jgi:uncharacterized membrane protein YfcA
MAIFIIGLIGGVFSGLLGIGAGSIFILGLTMIYHLTQPAAQGLALAIMIPTSFLGAIVYYKKGLYAKNILKELIIGGMLGAFLGSFAANHISAELLRKIFSIVIFYFGVKLLRS